MNEKVKKELSLIKTILEITQISFHDIAIFFIGTGLIFTIDLIALYFIRMTFKKLLVPYTILEALHFFVLVFFYIYCYNKLHKLQNRNNIFLLHTWGLTLIVCEFLSSFVSNILLTKLFILTEDYNIYATVSLIFSLCISIIPLAITVIITGIFINSMSIKIYGFLLMIFYILSFYLYYSRNINYDIYSLYDIVYIFTFLFLGLTFKLKNYRSNGD